MKRPRLIVNTKGGAMLLKKRCKRFLLLTVTALPATTDATVLQACTSVMHDHSYDTDSVPIGIDNHASYCLTNSEQDFVGPTKTVHVQIKGITQGLKTAKVGTVRWKIEDDEGIPRTVDLPGTYLVKDLPLWLLAPQHLAQVQQKKEKTKDGTICVTIADRVVIRWNDKKFTHTIFYNKSNVAVLRTAPGYQRYTAFEANLDSAGAEPRAFDAHVVPPDDDQDDSVEHNGDSASISDNSHSNSPYDLDPNPTAPLDEVQHDD
jgi:hypothetical protein